MSTIYTGKVLNMLTNLTRWASIPMAWVLWSMLFPPGMACQGLDWAELDSSLEPVQAEAMSPLEPEVERPTPLPREIALPAGEPVGLSCRQRLENREWTDPCCRVR